MVIEHALRNSLIATITVLAVNLGWLISSAVVIEQVFDIPSLGQLLVDPVTRDFPTIQALTLVFRLLVIAINPLVRPCVRACRPARPVRLMATRQELILSSAGRMRRRAAGEAALEQSKALCVGLGIAESFAVAAVFAPLIAPCAPNTRRTLRTRSSRATPRSI